MELSLHAMPSIYHAIHHAMHSRPTSPTVSGCKLSGLRFNLWDSCPFFVGFDRWVCIWRNSKSLETVVWSINIDIYIITGVYNIFQHNSSNSWISNLEGQTETSLWLVLCDVWKKGPHGSNGFGSRLEGYHRNLWRKDMGTNAHILHYRML